MPVFRVCLMKFKRGSESKINSSHFTKVKLLDFFARTLQICIAVWGSEGAEMVH